MKVPCRNCQTVYTTEDELYERTTQWIMDEKGELWVRCSCGAQIVFPKNKTSWYKPEKLMSENAQELYNKIKSQIKIPKIPAAIKDIQRKIDDANSTAKGIGDILKKAPTIQAELLRFASFRAGLTGNKIASSEHAVTFLGRSFLSNLITSDVIGSCKFASKKFEPEDFWYDSYLTGMLMEELEKKFAMGFEPGEAYIAGSLCNIGKLIYGTSFPDAADAIYMAIIESKYSKPWHVIEHEMGFPNHCHLGEIAAVMWGLPSYAKTTIRDHHSLDEENPRNFGTALANQLCHWVKGEPYLIQEAVVKMCKDFFKMDDSDLELLVRELGPKREELHAFLAESQTLKFDRNGKKKGWSLFG